MDETNSISASGLEQFALKQDQNKPKDELGQSQFLELMLTQIKYQNPLQPAESGEFLSQLAQFGTVNGITELRSSFDKSVMLKAGRPCVSNISLIIPMLMSRAMSICPMLTQSKKWQT